MGEIPRVESFWIQRFAFGENTVVTAEKWKAEVPNMVVWFDFLSIPQMSACNIDLSIPQMAACNMEDEDEEEEDKEYTLEESQVSLFYARADGLSEVQRKTVEKLKEAVESIPAYVERTSLLLVLVPVSKRSSKRCVLVDSLRPFPTTLVSRLDLGRIHHGQIVEGMFRIQNGHASMMPTAKR